MSSITTKFLKIYFGKKPPVSSLKNAAAPENYSGAAAAFVRIRCWRLKHLVCDRFYGNKKTAEIPPFFKFFQ